MRLYFGLFIACILLAACASDDPRYRDTSTLEKPPLLVIEKQESVTKAPESPEADKLPEDATQASDSDEDQEEGESKTKRGLGEQAVSINAAPPSVLTIRQPFDSAWNLLKRALIQSGIEVTDLEHDKGRFYVSYDADSYVSEHGSVIEKTVGLFSNDYVKQAYVLTVSPEDSVTKVTAAPGKDTDYRKRTDHDDEIIVGDADVDADADKPTDGADKLLRSLYLTLKDKLRED